MAARGYHSKVILSWHEVKKTPGQKALQKRIKDMAALGPDIVKIVPYARRYEDNLTVLNLLSYGRRRAIPLIAFAMGPYGRMSRVMAGLMGSLFTYVAPEKGTEVPGAIDTGGVDQRVEGNRMTIKGDMVFYLLGNPIRHSLSPLMHRAAYAAMNVPACYHACCVEDLTAAVSAMRGLEIRGASVTIPFKEALIPLLDEVDEEARQIGAVNTVINNEGQLKGVNTDGRGFIRALEEATPLAGKGVLVLGAGGTARAVVFHLLKEGAHVWVTNRTTVRGRGLADAMGGTFVPWGEAERVKAEILVNTTLLGMYPESSVSPWSSERLTTFETVVDVIYNPRQTKLLQDAHRAGCKTVEGLRMFVYQGAEQMRLWMGEDPPLAIMQEVVEEALSRHGS